MADFNRGNRPLSPHLAIYRRQMNTAMSIFHRLTGLGLAPGAVLLVWWLLAAAGTPERFARVDGLLTSWLGGLILILSLGALCYHFFTGIRHLLWDTGAGFALDHVRKTGYAALGGAAIMFVIVLIASI